MCVLKSVSSIDSASQYILSRNGVGGGGGWLVEIKIKLRTNGYKTHTESKFNKLFGNYVVIVGCRVYFVCKQAFSLRAKRRKK